MPNLQLADLVSFSDSVVIYLGPATGLSFRGSDNLFFQDQVASFLGKTQSKDFGDNLLFSDNFQLSMPGSRAFSESLAFSDSIQISLNPAILVIGLHLTEQLNFQDDPEIQLNPPPFVSGYIRRYLNDVE